MEIHNVTQLPGSLKVEKAYTFFMIPFFYEGEWGEIHKHISRWQPQKEEMYREDILYPYIMELFKPSIPKDGNPPTNKIAIYQLHTEDKGNQSEFFFDRIIGKNQVAILEEGPFGQKKPYALPFKVLNEGNNAPHLFISPSAQIGVMTICVELGNGCNIQDLQQFNYCLHKRNEITNIVIGEKDLPDGKKKKKTEKRTVNYRIVCPSPETNKLLSDAEIMGTVIKYLNFDGYKQLTHEVGNINNEHINWDLNYLVDFLLNTWGWKSQVKYFNKERMHIYTFCSIDDTKLVGDKITIDDIIPHALRLSRVVNHKYLLPIDEMVTRGVFLQTYENIFFSSAIEGTAMICIAKDINKSFIGDMQNMFNRQYLLVYMLVLLQRYTLLSIDRRLTEYDARNDNTDDGLWALIRLICKIKVNCYYTDVSVYTHHSQFYQHCCKNLHIPETFEEIDGKVELLKLTTDRRIQEALEKQRKLQEEEAKRHQEEIERIKNKEKEEEERIRKEREENAKKQREVEENLKREKEDTERRQNILNIIVAILTVAQVVQAVYELWNPDPCKDTTIPLITGLVCLVLLIGIARKDIVRFIRKTKNN